MIFSTENCKICILIIICVIVFVIFWISSILINISVIEKSDELDKLSWIEKKYGKKYPLGDDKFQIIHYPKYSSFFDQFNNYLYLVKKVNENIIATCCFATICKNIYYICDLKKIGQTSGATFSFVAYFYYLNIFCPNMTIFGIVMEPNDNINYISNKFGFKKIKIFNLYKIKFDIVCKNYNLLNKIFPNFFIIPGYKKFVLESSANVIDCYHIAEPMDCQIVKIQERMEWDKANIGVNADIMFCIDTNSKFIIKLEKAHIKPINLMNVISNKQITNDEFDLDKIKTYMI